ncbi:MAG: hypothetical protein QXJ17_04480 [Nitrososphaeria archaeon]
MNWDWKKVAAAVIGLLVVAYFAYPYLMPKNSIETNVEGSGGSGATAVARPFIDYRTEDGKVLRVYLDDESKYWVNPDGSLTPYTGLVWTVPGTLTQIAQVKFGFTLSLSGKYLKDLNSDSQQDITVFVTAQVKNNGTGSYSVFSSSKYTYQVGSPSSGGSTNPTIESNFLDISTLFTNVWGGSPAQDTTYWPYYYVSISVNATSVWNEPLTQTASQNYDKNSIGSWNWKQAELSASLGGASGSTQSVVNLQDPQTQFGVILGLGVAVAAVTIIRKRWD